MTTVQFSKTVASVKLQDMVDLALGTPEVGAVNFNVLHTLLHAMLRKMNMNDTIIDLNEEEKLILGGGRKGETLDGRESVLTVADSGITDLNSVLGTDEKRPSSSPYHALQDRVNRLEKQIETVNSLPNSKEMIAEMLGSVTDKQQKVVSDMWSLLSTKKRLDTNEEGLGRLSSLLDDLMREMAKLREENNVLQQKLKDMADMSSIWDKLNNLESFIGQFLKLKDEFAQLQGDLAKYPSPESFSNLVTWDALESALRGLKEEMDRLKQPPPERIVVNMATDPTSRPQSARNVASPGPSAALQEMLESLGALTTKHDLLDGRVVKLEEEMPLKANKSDLDNLKLPDDLLKTMQDLKGQMENLLTLRSRDNEAMARIREALNHIQKQVDKFNEALQLLSDDSRSSLERIEKLFHITSDHEDRKADIRFVEECVQPKADLFLLDGKVNFNLFDETTGTLHKLIQDLLKKLELAEQELRRLLDELSNGMGDKLDKNELDLLREWLEKRLKALAAKIKASGTFTSDGDDDAAGLRRQLLQHFHCISCDRPLDVVGHVPFPSIPEKPGLPSNKSMRPHTVFELESMRQQAKNVSSELLDLYQTPRPCGGTHTVTQPHKRITRVPITTEEEVSASPPKHYKEELDLQGVDGHIYKGRKERAYTFYSSGATAAAAGVADEKLPPMKHSGKSETKSGRYTPRSIAPTKVSFTNDDRSDSLLPSKSNLNKNLKASVHPPSPSMEMNLDELGPSLHAIPTGRDEKTS